MGEQVESKTDSDLAGDNMLFFFLMVYVGANDTGKEPGDQSQLKVTSMLSCKSDVVILEMALPKMRIYTSFIIEGKMDKSVRHQSRKSFFPSTT
ncbi:uncharacterized protein LOC143233116 isoform X3 [Tachypleus tridentatus]|uniref:uncharacterized protein LOC143233116 isoform X3 n=1 Tax=Tachypleus tridentatus TaxID=6853 RepID=UPI003FD693AC